MESDTGAAIVGFSPVLTSWLAQEPSLCSALAPEELRHTLTLADYRGRLGNGWGDESPEDFLRRLRRWKRRELSRIVGREALRLAPVDVTSGEVSAFAEASIEACLDWALRKLEQRYGPPFGDDGRPVTACVLGMGKLGGNELNLCSDVDLLFLFDTTRGRTAGGRDGTTDVRTFTASLVRLVSDALGRVTEDGLVFRVDLGLRPDGRSGDLAQSVENAVAYYLSWGQTWERAVLLRARPVAGNTALGRAFLSEVEPFVYRRSLDFTTVEDFKDLKKAIDQNQARRLGNQDDLKLGRGGIRELEFFVQTLQLIHGGRLPAVRERNTLAALGCLRDAGLLEPADVDGLAKCWRFLRGLEHAVQSLHFLQTHRLPKEEGDVIAIAGRFGYSGAFAADQLRRDLAEVRAEVHGAFQRLFYGAEREWEQTEAGACEPVEPRADPEGGASDAPILRVSLETSKGRRAREIPARSRRILNRIRPFLLREAATAPNPDRALRHLEEFLEVSGASAGYLSLLQENPPTARLLVRLFGTSGFLSRYLITHPELLDDLVLGSPAVRQRSRADLEGEISGALRNCRDEEESMDALRRFRNAEVLRIAMNDLWGGLSAEDVSRQITAVAESCLRAAHDQAYERLAAKYGQPRAPNGALAHLAILGLGKLGGQEIDYQSDLDVVFLYSGNGATDKAGSRALSNADFFARLGRRIIGTLGERTREGIAFRMDARLRPSGQAGPLVTSLEAFAAYHDRGSAVWERQALVKLRPVAGHSRTGSEAVAVAHRLLYSAAPAEDVKPAIARMRERMETEIARGSGRGTNIKTGFGGLVDVEFAVQAMQLEHGWKNRGLRPTNTLEALQALARHRVLGPLDSGALSRGYAFLRRVEARLRILVDRPTDTLPGDPAGMGELARGLGYGGASPQEQLSADLQRHRRLVRAAYDRVVKGESH